MVTQAPARPGQAAPAGGKQAAPAPRPLAFPVGVLKTEDPDYDVTQVQTAAAQQYPNHQFEPNAWLRGFYCQFDMTVTGQATNSVTFTKDTPFSGIQKVTLKDKGNREVFGPLSGYDWMTTNKFGGYHQQGDPRADITYTAVTGTGATAGSFSFVLYLPMELVARDALGTVENKSASSAWKLELWIDSQANTYGQVPSVMGSLRVRITEDGYTEPASAMSNGRPYAETPPAPGTLQYWASENANLNAGTQSYIQTNGISYPIRNIIYKLVDTAAGTRAAGDGDWPDPATLAYGKVQLFQRFKTTWLARMGRSFGFFNSTPDTALARENGVFPVWFNQDFGLEPGAELRNGYLITKTGTVLKLSGSLGAAATLFVLTNYVIPPGNDAGKLRPGG